MNLRGWFLFIFVGMIVSCGPSYMKQPPLSNGALSENALIDYKLVKDSVLNNCTSCHSGRNQPNLMSYGELIQNGNKILLSVTKNEMPPTSDGYLPLSECKKAILQRWFQDGAPVSAGVTVGSLPECKGLKPAEPELPLEQMPVTYQTLLTRILQPKCIQCHKVDGDTEASEMLFYPYSEFMANKKIFVGETPEKTKLINVVTRKDEDAMPPLDSKIDPLTDDEVGFLKRWILNGKPEK